MKWLIQIVAVGLIFDGGTGHRRLILWLKFLIDNFEIWFLVCLEFFVSYLFLKTGLSAEAEF